LICGPCPMITGNWQIMKHNHLKLYVCNSTSTTAPMTSPSHHITSQILILYHEIQTNT
jgi:hypothetical protein